MKGILGGAFMLCMAASATASAHEWAVIDGLVTGRADPNRYSVVVLAVRRTSRRRPTRRSRPVSTTCNWRPRSRTCVGRNTCRTASSQSHARATRCTPSSRTSCRVRHGTGDREGFQTVGRMHRGSTRHVADTGGNGLAGGEAERVDPLRARGSGARPDHPERRRTPRAVAGHAVNAMSGTPAPRA